MVQRTKSLLLSTKMTPTEFHHPIKRHLLRDTVDVLTMKNETNDK